MSRGLAGVPWVVDPAYPVSGAQGLRRPFIVDGVTYRVVDIPDAEEVVLKDGRLEEEVEAWAQRVGGMLWVLDSEATGWPLSVEDEGRAWGMVKEGTRRLREMGASGPG